VASLGENDVRIAAAGEVADADVRRRFGSILAAR